MGRDVPLHVLLAQFTQEARERQAEKVLTVTAIRDAGSKAARAGLNHATIPLGLAPLQHTRQAQALVPLLSKFSYEWREGVAKDGSVTFDLWLSWD